MTPDQRTALHRLIDQAFNLNATVTVDVFSKFTEDNEPLISLLQYTTADDTDPLTRTIQPNDSPTGRRYRVIKASPDATTEVTVFTDETTYRRGGSGERYDVV